MDDNRYKNREIDRMNKEITDDIAELKASVESGFTGVYARQDKLDRNQQYTNGKLKRVILWLIAIGAFAIGTGVENISTLIKLLT